MKITNEVVQALSVLREAARKQADVSAEVADAINTLDNADVFIDIDDAAPVRFDVDVTYKVPGRSTMVKVDTVEAYDHQDAVAQVTGYLIEQLVKASLIGTAEELEIVSVTTNPCA